MNLKWETRVKLKELKKELNELFESYFLTPSDGDIHTEEVRDLLMKFQDIAADLHKEWRQAVRDGS